MLKKQNIIFINRGFWPEYDVPGESLLYTAEQLSRGNSVSILTSSKMNIKKECTKYNRGVDLDINTFCSFTNSNSSILMRIFESVFFCIWSLFKLIRIKPNYVYFATDPPITIPLIVYIYSRLFKIKYIYHLQDIHPEATRLVINIPVYLHKILVKIDNIIIKNAYKVITLNDDMALIIDNRLGEKKDIYKLANASQYPEEYSLKNKGTIIFAGNAGRFQNIKLLVQAIDEYLKRGGNLKFIFIGSGIFYSLIESLGEKHVNVSVKKYMCSKDVIEIMKTCEWGLLPIDKDIIRYAFPSKSSAYIATRLKIFGICPKNSSMENWIKTKNNGIYCEANKSEIIDKLNEIERGVNVKICDDDVSIEKFSHDLIKIISSQ